MTGTLNEAPPELTDRQRQVIELIARGCSNEEVGLRLGISPRTAKAHCDVLRQNHAQQRLPVAACRPNALVLEGSRLGRSSDFAA
jgi:DNA-binding NarL/FixJ family response regulator